MDNTKINNCKLITLQQINDGVDGIISVAENNNQIPFDIKRVYCIYNLDNQNAIRGQHSHKALEQVIFCVNGNFTLSLDDGENKKEIMLDNPNTGVYLGIDLWHTMSNFSKDCVLLVLSSDFYDESDYIRDYDQFIKYVINRNDSF